MTLAQNYLQSAFGPSFSKTLVRSRPLSLVESGTLRLALVNDARIHYYGALVSVIDAIRGLGAGFYTWSTIKLYYAIFYALRALLELDGHALLYVTKSPFNIDAEQGATASASTGTTHAAVQSLFGSKMHGHYLLSQEIGLQKPLKWLTERREEANYTEQFPEPAPPEHFKLVEREGVRALINAYIGSPLGRYAFDPDHAMLAFPITALVFAKRRISGPLSEIQKTFFETNCKDGSGKIPTLIRSLALD